MMKVYKYMACQLPEVLYDLPEGHWSVGDAALYAKPNDSIDFDVQIGILLDSESLRRQLSTSARRAEDKSRTVNLSKVDIAEGLCSRSPRPLQKEEGLRWYSSRRSTGPNSDAMGPWANG